MNVATGKQPSSTPFDAWAVLEFWVRRWRWLAAWTIVMAIVGAFTARGIWRKSYTATAELMHYEPSSVEDTYHPREISAPSLIVMLQAPGILEEVGSQLHPPLTARILARRIDVELDRNNDVVNVTATGSTRDEAVDLVNRFCAAAIANTKAMQKQEATEADETVTHQLSDVNSEIADARKAVPEASRAAVTALSAGPYAAPQAPTALQLRIQTARDQLEDLLSRYTDEHPLVREQRARLQALEDEEKQAPQGQAAVAAAPSAPAVPPELYGRITPEEVAMGENLRVLETNRALLISRQHAIQPFRDDPPGYFRVLLSAANSPTQLRRYRLEVLLFTIMGGFLGLLGAAIQILLSEFMDNRIKTRADVRRVTGLPLLATLGDLKEMTPSGRDQWAFRAWTALQSKLSISPNHGMVCGITSANSSDGRTTWVNLLAGAASACGFRVLTISAQPSEEMEKEVARRENRPPAALPKAPDVPTTSLTTSVLSTPAQIVEKLTSAECPPVVSIPLPGWVWNLERRRQWRAALEAWRAIEHVVIFVELPPAFLAETVLLAENIPNLLWLVDSNKSDAAQTLIGLETLRDASCNLVGAVLNRERAMPVRGQFSRWLGSSALALMLALGLGSARASAEDVDANPGAAPRSAFSAGVPAQRQEWQRHMTLGAGDVLSFHLFGSPELTREDEPVGPDGRVSYLEADNVMAAGLTVDELRDRLNSELGRYRRAAQVYVTPVAYHSKKYFVLGTVVKKGVFYMDRPITVIEAVARARGFETGISHGDTVEATDFSRSFLSRGGQRVPVDFGRLFLHGDLSQNVELQPNDCLFFPGVSGGEIYVLGEVGSPGPVPYDSDSSALSAIAARGGFTNKAWRARVLVVRGSLDHPQAYKVNIAGAFTGDSPNMALEPGDIVYVASSPWNRTEELIDRAGQAFAESAVVTWTGINVGPDIIHKP